MKRFTPIPHLSESEGSLVSALFLIRTKSSNLNKSGSAFCSPHIELEQKSEQEGLL